MPIIEHLYVSIFINAKKKKFNFISNESFNIFFINLQKEIIKFENTYKTNLKSVYVGGEDASLLSLEQLESVFLLLEPLVITQSFEYSFEINPNCIDEERANFLKKYNINRIVLPISTFQEEISKKNKKNIIDIKLFEDRMKYLKETFTNISFDLNFGLYKQTLKDIENDLQMCLKFKPSHITYDFGDQIDHDNIQNYIIFKYRTSIRKILISNGYEQYEYNNYVNDGKKYSVQLLSYHQNKNFYGIGPEASSLFHDKKGKYYCYFNRSKKNKWKSYKIKLKSSQIYFQILMQGLTLREGIDLKNDMENKKAGLFFKKKIDKFIFNHYLQEKNGTLACTEKGWINLNEILIDLLEK